MGYSENLHSYLNMTRKELQQLCKKHKIPANRSHVHLAKSLASLCKKKSVKSAFSEKKKSSPSLMSEKNVKEKLTPLTGNTQGSYERLISSVGGIHNQVKFLCTTSLEKPQINANTVHPSTANYRSSKFSTSNLGSLGQDYPGASDIRKTNAARLLGFVGNEIGKRNGFSEPGSSNQKFLPDAFTISRTCNATTARRGHNKPIECSTESGFVSADESSTRAPSFQFFVMSEAGINLCVDLESNPVEWINSLKDEVCIHQKGENHESNARTCDLPHTDDNVEKFPSGDSAIELQSNELEQNTECTNSAWSSVVSENGNSEAYPPDATIATSGSSVLTSGNAPADLGCLEENQVDSSSHFTHVSQENLTTDIGRDHGGAVLHEGADVSCRPAKSDVSLNDAPLKDTSNADNATINCSTNTTSADDGDVEAGVPFNASDQISAKTNISDEVKNTLEHFGSIKNQSEVVEDLISRSPMSEVPGEARRNEGSPNLCQFTGEVVLGSVSTDAQSEVGTENDHFYQQACGSSETSVLDVPLSSLNDEMGFGTPTRGKGAEGARAESSSDNNCKRSNNLELEELPSKRQQVCCENMNEALIHLKGTRSLAKETASDAIITPRRSTRLVPKVDCYLNPHLSNEEEISLCNACTKGDYNHKGRGINMKRGTGIHLVCSLDFCNITFNHFPV